MEIYNTKTRQKEVFKPLKDREVKLYFCGPTVYNYAHIGNFRTFIFEDIVIKVLKNLGYKVKTTMNITDVDDKTIRDSMKAGEKLKDFTEKYTEIFLKDIKKLYIEKADDVVPVSSLIPEMVRMINTMLKRKNAYLSDDGSIYFDVKSFKKYGKFANLDMSGMKPGARVDNDEYEKDSVSDFVLWKAWKEDDGENFWEEEFEVIIQDKKQTKVKLKGRPGWHIECSACNIKYLGPQIDIHIGGVDLIFPHHQNEIAQTESCTRKEFSKYWLHGGHLMVDGKKMSKSKDNFYTLADLEKKFEVLEEKNISKSVFYRGLRYCLINGKYRDSIDFSFSKLEASFNTIRGIDETIKLIKNYKKVEKQGVSREFSDYMQGVIQAYLGHLEDDFNVPEALAVVHDLLKFVNIGIRENSLSLEELNSSLDMFKTFNEVLGVFDFSVLDEVVIPLEVLEKLDARNKAKSEKDFELADNFRGEIEEMGYRVVDDKEGSRVERG